MKHLMILAGAFLLGTVVYKQYFKPPLPPPPPPPPPAINLPPQPVLSPPELRKVLDTTRDLNPSVRWEALRFLLQLKVPEAETILFQMVSRDPEPGLRKSAVELLSDRRGPQITAALTQALRDENEQVRIAALQALAKVGDFATAPAISEALRDTSEAVRLQALATLNSLQQKKNEEVRLERERQEQLRQEMLRKQAEAGRR